MSTGDVFLSVSSQAPNNAKRMLSPLIEDDENENPIQKVSAEPNFGAIYEDDELNAESEKDIFITENTQTEFEDENKNIRNQSTPAYSGTELEQPESVDGSHDQSKSDVINRHRSNSAGEMFDEIYSDRDTSEESNDDDYETDLEVDEEKWLYPERFDLDLTGEQKYIKVCEDMGISPTTYFIKHIQDRELKMKFHGLGPQRMKALSVPLQTNTNIEILNLEGNAIDSEGAICLTKVLKENFFITELDLRRKTKTNAVVDGIDQDQTAEKVLAENNLGTDGGRAICEMLINNRNIYKIDLSGNEIGDGAAPMIYEVLTNNKLLKILLLAKNSFEDEGARQFKTALSDNITLEVLDLSWNHFKTRGATLLAEAIEENIGLKSFNIAMAGLGRSGAEALSKALRENRTLLELDVSLNRIDMDGAVALANGIRDNDTLQVFKCGSNPFDSDGAMEILEAVDCNDSSELKLVDFSNIMVKMNFAKLQVRLQDERGIKVVNEGIIPEFPRTNSARLTAFRVDPIGAFKMYADSAEVDLGELLVNSLDEDYTIAMKEFKSNIKKTKIDISDEQLGLIALRLSRNGRVNCRALFDIEEGPEEDTVPAQENPTPVSTSRSEKPPNSSRSMVSTPGRSSIK